MCVLLWAGFKVAKVLLTSVVGVLGVSAGAPGPVSTVQVDPVSSRGSHRAHRHRQGKHTLIRIKDFWLPLEHKCDLSRILLLPFVTLSTRYK